MLLGLAGNEIVKFNWFILQNFLYSARLYIACDVLLLAMSLGTVCAFLAVCILISQIGVGFGRIFGVLGGL